MKTDLENRVLALRGKHYSPSEIVKLTGWQHSASARHFRKR